MEDLERSVRLDGEAMIFMRAVEVNRPDHELLFFRPRVPPEIKKVVFAPSLSGFLDKNLVQTFSRS
jgi:hypothetical protein